MLDRRFRFPSQCSASITSSAFNRTGMYSSTVDLPTIKIVYRSKPAVKRTRAISTSPALADNVNSGECVEGFIFLCFRFYCMIYCTGLADKEKLDNKDNLQSDASFACCAQKRRMHVHMP